MPDSYLYGKWYEEHISEVSGPSGSPIQLKENVLFNGFMVLQTTGLTRSFNAKISFESRHINQNMPKSRSQNQIITFSNVLIIILGSGGYFSK